MIVIPKPGTLWVHIASSRIYRVLHIAMMEDDYTKVVVYRIARPEPGSDETIWVRPVKEWAGRFKHVAEIP